MPITKRPTTKNEVSPNADTFIGNAPDAIPEEKTKKGVIRGKREQISHTMPPELLKRLDAMAEKKGLTRAGLMNLAISEYLER